MRRHVIWFYSIAALVVVSIVTVYLLLYALQNNNAALVWWALVAIFLALLASGVSSVYFVVQLVQVKQERDTSTMELVQVKQERDTLAMELVQVKQERDASTMELVQVKQLTDRQSKILSMSLSGVTVPQIATICDCSERTIERERSALCARGFLSK